VSPFVVLSGIDWIVVLSVVSLLSPALLQAAITPQINKEAIMMYDFIDVVFVFLIYETIILPTAELSDGPRLTIPLR